jgi:hypothetical protein
MQVAQGKSLTFGALKIFLRIGRYTGVRDRKSLHKSQASESLA